jgi:hypothetical protein
MGDAPEPQQAGWKLLWPFLALAVGAGSVLALLLGPAVTPLLATLP